MFFEKLCFIIESLQACHTKSFISVLKNGEDWDAMEEKSDIFLKI